MQTSGKGNEGTFMDTNKHLTGGTRYETYLLTSNFGHKVDFLNQKIF